MTGFVIAAYIQPALKAFLQQGGRLSSLADAIGVNDWPLKETRQLPSQSIKADSLVDQVKQHLEHTLIHNPKVSQIAAMLGISERSLQRKLKLQKVSFQQILTTVRLQQAYDYL